MNKFVISKPKTTIDSKNKSFWIKVAIYITLALGVLFLISIPWRSYIAKKNLSEGEKLLTERKYTEALVHFQKAEILYLSNSKTSSLSDLTLKSSRDISAMKEFLREKNEGDLLKLIDDAEAKNCKLDADKILIERDLAQVAIINLKFCTTEGPKDYSSWLLLGTANIRASENGFIFKEQKPEYRKDALFAFESAYKVDPINKSAIEYLIATQKIENNQKEVDRWQKLLDNLIEIEK